jgi:hypothetical protein
MWFVPSAAVAMPIGARLCLIDNLGNEHWTPWLRFGAR